MDFLKDLIAFFNSCVDDENVVICPPEVQADDIEREKSYLFDLPKEPENVYVFKEYNTKVPTLVDKQAGVRYVQIIVRNRSNKMAYANINRIWKFLLKRPELIEDINDHRWCIFDVRNGPVKLENDTKGNYLWSLSFPVTTNLY